MSSLEHLKKWLEQHRSEVCEDYFQFLRFKSISTDPAYEKEVRKCAEWVCDYVGKHTALKTELLEIEGHPLVYGENLQAGPEAQTVLIYGHYDVQPVEPLEKWISPPFEPTERNGKIYARGAVDDKGQIFYAISALRAWKELGRELPINLKICIEGEEESGSVGFSQAILRLKEKLKSDSLLAIDFGVLDAHTPALTMGGRGLIALEVILQGSANDLHSGVHGGIAYNPNRAMAELLSQLWDEKGCVQIKGFYDDVIELSETEKKQYAFRENDQEGYSKKYGVWSFGGEKGRPIGERATLRPTLEINGIGGGYFGPGFKTVIPAQCVAKLSCRLVPNQDPKKIAQEVAHFLKSRAAPGMKVDVKIMEGEKAYRGSLESLVAKAVAEAATEVTGRECEHILSPGSIPIMAKLIRELQVKVVGMGYGLATDDIHAPNEHFDMNRFEKGFLTVGRALELL